MEKIIICSPQLGLSPDSSLGGEVHDRELLKALADLGVEIHIILPLFKKHENHKNFHFYYLPVPFVYPPWLFNLLILPYIIYIYLRTNFSILRVSSPYFIGPAATALKWLFPDIRVVATYHHLESSNFFDFIDRSLIGRFDKIVAVSEFTKKTIWNRYKSHLKNKNKLSVIYNGVNQKYRAKEKEERLVNNLLLSHKKILLYLGQLIIRKNIIFLFEVLKKLPQEYSLIVAGKGPQEKNLKNSALHNNLLGRIVFLGKVPESLKVDLFSVADYFVYPSIKEGFGMALTEALRCGKLAITSDLLVFKEIINNGVNGFSLPLDPKLWANRIVDLNKNPERKARIEKQAVKSSLIYDWRLSASKYLDLLGEQIYLKRNL